MGWGLSVYTVCLYSMLICLVCDFFLDCSSLLRQAGLNSETLLLVSGLNSEYDGLFPVFWVVAE